MANSLQNDEIPTLTNKPRKRRRNEEKSDTRKKKRLSSHVTGNSCNCKRFKCFELTSENEREGIIAHYNSLSTKNEQHSYLASLIRCDPVKRRRSRKPEEEAVFHDYSYKYHVFVMRETSLLKVAVCAAAFLAIFGITKAITERIKTSLTKTGVPPVTKQGMHNNRPSALTQDDKNLIRQHIQSFKGRKSHYSLKTSKKLYLPEELNVKAMYELFKEKYPDSRGKYDVYNRIFNTEFNVGFGYPRKDTCSTCDELNSKIDHQNKIIASSTGDEAAMTTAQTEKETLVTDRQLHLRKADVFYERKRHARNSTKTRPDSIAIAFDFWKNLPCPNVSTNDVYYRRQLSFYTFNVHVLTNNSVFLYCYDETVAKKGADDVASMLYDLFFNQLSIDIRTLYLFCDGCAGQNKNYTVFRFLHYCVHESRRFDSIVLRFPVRGHSYMECDKDMGNLNQKSLVETPSEWRNVIKLARKNPTPFNIVNMTNEMFFAYTAFLKPLYKATNPIATRPVREIAIEKEHPRFIKHRDSWNGQFESAVVTKPKPKKKGAANILRPAKLQQAYNGALPISVPKYADLQVLKKFCSVPNQTYFDQLPQFGNISDSDSAE